MEGKSAVKVLIVEDDRVTGHLLGSMLREEGYSVAGAVPAAEEALDLARDVRPDVILMDIFLAGDVDGIAASEAIRHELNVPVIFMTSHTETEVIDRVKVTEPYGYLVKPVTRDRLFSLIEIGLYRHAIERQRRESEDKYRSLFNHMISGFAYFEIKTDSTGKPEDFMFIEINRSFAEMFNLAEEDIRGQSGIAVFEPRGCLGREWLPVYGKAALLGESFSFEEYSAFLDRWFQVSLYSPKKNFLALIVSDISERKSVEEALQDSYAKVRALLDSSTDSIALIDTKGVVLDANEAIARRFNKPLNEFIGSDFIAYIETGLSLARMERVQEVIDEKKPVRFEDYRAGRWNDNKISPIIDGHGRVTGVSIFSRDVTEQKRLDNILMETNESLEGVFNAIMDSIVLLDRNGRILNINKTGALKLNSRKELLIGTCFWDAFREEVSDIRRSYFEKVIATGEPENFNDNRDGLYFEITIYPITDLKGEVDRVAFYAKDVTARIELEKAILEVAEKERIRIAGDLHDGLGQNLTGLSFLMGGLKKKMEVKAYPEIEMMQPILELVKESVAQAQALSRGLYPVNLDRHGFIMALEEMAESVSGVFNVRCQVHYDRQIVIRNIQTATHLYYIAREAVNNAVKHSGADTIRIILHYDDSHFSMTIMDNGRGLEVHSSPEEGIGLKTMRHRARLIRGDIITENCEKGGFQVAVSLRLREEEVD